MVYARYIWVGTRTLILICSTPIVIRLSLPSFDSIQLFIHSFIHSFRFRFILFFEMKSVFLLGAFCALVPSISAAVVYSDDAQVLRVNRPRHINSESIRQVRDGDHISSLNIRSDPQTIGSIDLAGTINPGIILSM
jgi:hypothetical protein